jgi:hypothetical protein
MADKDWRVTWEFKESASGRLMDTTACLREHTSVPGADSLGADTVAADIDSWTTTAARAMAYSGLELARIAVNRGGPFGPGEGDPAESGEKSVTLAGTLPGGTGTLLAYPECMRVTLRTSLASRRGRGRFHAPWPCYGSYKSATAPDNWNVGGGYWNAVVAFANLLLAGRDVTHDTITHHYSLRVHSRKDGVTRDVTAIVPRVQVSFLRSRFTAP